MKEERILIFTDGASKGNPGPGGFGALVVREGSVRELGGFESNTTNNRMELQAVIASLEVLGNTDKPITIYTDSRYVKEGSSAWVFGWQRSGWVTKDKKEVLNRDLWERILGALQGKDVSWKLVSGHVGIPGNERVNTIASEYAEGKSPALYVGSLEDYGVAVFDVAPDEAMQNSKSRNKGKAYSYVSSVDGVIYVDATWDACLNRVKGVPHTKYRKALSKEDEIKIIEQWKKDT